MFSLNQLKEILKESNYPEKIRFDIYDFENTGDMPNWEEEEKFGDWIQEEMRNLGYYLKCVQEKFPATYCFIRYSI
jgi:hypothetical protein